VLRVARRLAKRKQQALFQIEFCVVWSFVTPIKEIWFTTN